MPTDAIQHSPDEFDGTDKPPPAESNPARAAVQIGGQYRVVRSLGGGSYGEVVEAEDEQLLRRVAIKILRREFIGDERVKARFLREARALATLNHDHIVKVHGVGQLPAGLPYLVMPLLVGHDLRTRLLAGPLKLPVAAAVVRQAALGLAFAHKKGLVHRDIKPANIWLERTPGEADDRVLLLDFGLARGNVPGPSVEASTVNRMKGSMAYASPEQVKCETADPPADVFSLGVVFYEALAGRRPFLGPGEFFLSKQIVEDRHPPLAEIDPTLPRAFCDLINRMLAKDPADRPTARAVADALAPPRGASAANWSMPELTGRYLQPMVWPGNSPTQARHSDYRLRTKMAETALWEVFAAESDSRPGQLVYRRLKPTDPESRGVCLQATEHLAELSHKNIEPVVDFGDADGRAFLVTRYTHGTSLRAYLEDLRQAGKVMLPHYAASIAHQIAGGLAAAHADGMTHDLLHPGCIWLGVNERRKVDRVLVSGFTNGWVRDAVLRDPLAFATFDPELAAERAYSGWAVDLYRAPGCSDRLALAAILSEMLTGERPTAVRRRPSRIWDVFRRPFSLFAGGPGLPRELRPLVAALGNDTVETSRAAMDDVARQLGAFAVPR